MVPGSVALVLGTVPRGKLLNVERFGADEFSLLGCGVQRRSSLRMVFRRSPGAGVPQRGPGLYAVPPCGDVWTCFSRASRMSLVISCLCIVLSVTLTCADVLNSPLRCGDVNVCICFWGFTCRLYLWPATLEVKGFFFFAIATGIVGYVSLCVFL